MDWHCPEFACLILSSEIEFYSHKIFVTSALIVSGKCLGKTGSTRSFHVTAAIAEIPDDKVLQKSRSAWEFDRKFWLADLFHFFARQQRKFPIAGVITLRMAFPGNGDGRKNLRLANPNRLLSAASGAKGVYTFSWRTVPVMYSTEQGKIHSHIERTWEHQQTTRRGRFLADQGSSPAPWWTWEATEIDKRIQIWWNLLLRCFCHIRASFATDVGPPCMDFSFWNCILVTMHAFRSFFVHWRKNPPHDLL